MFLRQTPDFVNFVLAAAGDVRNSSGDGERGKHQEDIRSLQQLGTLRYWTSDISGQRPNNGSGQQ